MHRRPILPSRHSRSTLRILGMAAAMSVMATVSVSCAADGNGAVAEPTAPAGTTAASPTSGSTIAGSPTTLSGGPSADAPEALRFSAPTVGGGTLDLASFAGSTVLFWFWAPG